MLAAVNSITADPGRNAPSDTAAPLPPVKAPWLSDLSTTTCLCCSKDFGIFNRRHHCRMCGGLFCDDCSSRKVRDVQGYAPEALERICDVCYFNDVALLVVYNLMFSGWKCKFYSEYAAAREAYNEIPDYASRVFIKVGNGNIFVSFFKNDSWKQKVMDRAYLQIRKVLKPRIPLFWHPQAPGTAPATVMESMMRAHYMQTPRDGPTIAVTEGRTDPQVTAPRSDVRDSPRDASGGNCNGVLVVYRQLDGDATDHTWFFFPTASTFEVVEEAGRFLKGMPRLMYGGVLELTSPNVKHFYKAREASGSQGAYEQAFRQYLDGLGVMMATHVNGDYQTTFFSGLRLALEAIRSVETPLVLLDVAGNIVLSKGTMSQVWREGLARHAGVALTKQQQLSALIAVGPNQTVHAFDDLFAARKLISSSAGYALFAVASNAPSSAPALLQRHLFMTKADALLLAPLASDKVKSLINRQLVVVVPEAENAASASAVAQAPECQICFTAFDVNEHKPCLCSQCGNSMCFVCIKSVSLCPFCRKEMPVNGPWITNVQLLQLVSGSRD